MKQNNTPLKTYLAYEEEAKRRKELTASRKGIPGLCNLCVYVAVTKKSTLEPISVLIIIIVLSVSLSTYDEIRLVN